MYKISVVGLFILFISSNLFSQTSLELWQDHFSYVDVFSVIETNNNTIVGASQNGLILLKSDGSTEKLSKASGLSDIGVSAMNYNSFLNAIILAYSNGNIDIISDNNIINISDIKRKNINANKNINSVEISDNNAYLSCGFGIVKLDIENTEISDTYFIGQDASFVSVNKTIFINDSIFAATDEGLYSANINDYLADYNNWIKHSSSNFSEFKDIVLFNGKLYAIAKNISGEYQLVKQNSGSYEVINSDVGENAKIFVNDDLFLANYTAILKYNTSDALIQTISDYGLWDFRPQFVNFSSSGELIIADKFCGIVTSSDFSSHLISGVYLNESFNVKAYNDVVFVSRGGFKDNSINLWNKAILNVFSENKWSNIAQNDARDFVTILADESDLEHFYVGSWGYGLYEYKNGQLISHFDDSNSPLESIITGTYIRISGLAYDDEKNIWMINASDNYSINILKNDGTWKSLMLNHILAGDRTGDLIFTSNNQIWAQLPDKGLFVLDFNNTIDNENDDIYSVFYPRDENSDLIGSIITCIAEDKDGEIWFGSNEGVGVIYDAYSFDGTIPIANRIKITSELNDSLVTSYLLQNEQVNCIAIDGGNRKWFGTNSSGAYLMNSSGTKELLHFDSENSPLPSDKILSIAIEPKSGEIFFSTSMGLVSYRGTANEANGTFQDVYAYPNPVRHEYSGLIYIKGLVRDSNVKITDIAGNIVYETTSNGGMATWDGNNFDGLRVSTGVYLIFCSNSDGSDTFVSKLLFIK